MPTAIPRLAEYQPFTPVIDTVRGLLLDGPIGNNAVIVIAWCLAVAADGYLWARKPLSRDPVQA
jgi:ABC-2 type transport system permease protein